MNKFYLKEFCRLPELGTGDCSRRIGKMSRLAKKDVELFQIYIFKPLTKLRIFGIGLDKEHCYSYIVTDF